MVIVILFGVVITRLEELLVGCDHLFTLVFKGVGDLLQSQFAVSIIDITNETQYEHVLAAACVSDNLEALNLHRHLINDEAILTELFDRIGVGVTNLLLNIALPFVFKEDHCAILIGAVGDP